MGCVAGKEEGGGAAGGKGGEPTIYDVLWFTLSEVNPQFAISYNLQFEDEPTYMKVKVKYQAGDPGWGQEKTHNFF